MRKLAFVALLATVAACAPKTVPTVPVVPVVSGPPKFPEFITPIVPASFVGSRSAGNQDRGWRFLQAGDFRSAEREFQAALTAAPTFYPAESGLGYLGLARSDEGDALSHFDRALERQPRDLSALVGRGRSLVVLHRERDALAAFEAALAVDPSLAGLARTVDVLRFRGQQEDLARARQAARAGRFDEAQSAYARAIASSPDSSFLYRELATVEHQQGADDRALGHFRKAVELDRGDAKSLVQIGEILEGRGDVGGAVKAYTDALLSEPSDEVEGRLEKLRVGAELARLPEEYRAIDRSAQVTRADLAALVGIRLAPLVQAGRGREPALITDIRNHWAATWIVAVARAGVMEPFANHAFQPRAVVHRIDLAQVVSRLLARLAEASPGQANTWQSARLKFSDLGAGHLGYPAASAAVASGVMTIGANNSFRPSLVVSGSEAIAAIDAVARLDRTKRPVNASGRGGR